MWGVCASDLRLPGCPVRVNATAATCCSHLQRGVTQLRHSTAFEAGLQGAWKEIPGPAPVAVHAEVLDLGRGARAGARRAAAGAGGGVSRREQVQDYRVVQDQLLQALHVLVARCAHQHALAAARHLRMRIDVRQTLLCSFMSS